MNPAGGHLPGPDGLANVAMLRRFLDAPTEVLDECAQAYGPTFQLGLGPLKLVVVGDPADVSQVLAEPNDRYRWGYRMNPIGFIVGSTSLIVSDGADHRRRRGAVQPAFARRRLDGWIPMILSEADRMIDGRILPGLAEGEELDLYGPGKDLVLAVTVRAFFGRGLQARTSEIGRIFEVLQGYMELPGYRQLPHPIPGTRRSRARMARRQLEALVAEEVQARRAAAGDDGRPEADDLLDVLVGPEGADLSDREIGDQVNTLIGAGYNTTAATLAWAVHRSLAVPGLWGRLADEADAVLGAADAGGTPGPDELRSLTLAAAVVHETLRLHPAGVISPRQAAADVTLGGRTIPEGAMVAWSPYLAGRDAEVWGDPLVFRPERHLDATDEQRAAMDVAWVPFGRGPRRCVGFALAQMELILMLARFAQRLAVELVNTSTPEPYGMVVNRPLGGVPVLGSARATPSVPR